MTLNPVRSPHAVIDFLLQAMGAVQLFAWAALALYLLLCPAWLWRRRWHRRLLVALVAAEPLPPGEALVGAVAGTLPDLDAFIEASLKQGV